MENNIILTANGFNEAAPRSAKIDELFENITKGKNVLIIGNAAKVSNRGQREPVKNNFLRVGAKKVDLIDIDESVDLQILFDYDVIYVIGGDVGELLDLNYFIPAFKENIIRFLENGGIYIGESAGSIILADDCTYLYDVEQSANSPKPKYWKKHPSNKGLGLTSYNIIPHYEAVSEELKKAIAEYNGVNITTLNDGEFIITSYRNVNHGKPTETEI